METNNTRCGLIERNDISSSRIGNCLVYVNSRAIAYDAAPITATSAANPWWVGFPPSVTKNRTAPSVVGGRRVVTSCEERNKVVATLSDVVASSRVRCSSPPLVDGAVVGAVVRSTAVDDGAAAVVGTVAIAGRTREPAGVGVK